MDWTYYNCQKLKESTSEVLVCLCSVLYISLSVALDQCRWGAWRDASTWYWDCAGHPRQWTHLENNATSGKLIQGTKGNKRDIGQISFEYFALSFFLVCMWVLQFYAFSTFAMQLNELDKRMEGVIPSTDSRLRPDICAMEKGDIGTVRDLDFLCWARWM